MGTGNAAVWWADAERLAIRRALRLLVGQLSDALAEANRWDPDGEATALTMPAADRIYEADEAIDWMLRAGGVALSVHAKSAVRDERRLEGDPQYSWAIARWRLRAGVVFVAPPEHSAWREEWLGRTQTQKALTQELARAYRDAVGSVLLRSLPGGAGVMSAVAKQQFGDALEHSQIGLHGRGVVELELLQHLRYPKNLYDQDNLL